MINNIYELTFRLIKTITDSDRISIKAHGFVFQNLGDLAVYINGFTIPANSSFQLAAPDKSGIILIDGNVIFESGSGTKLLQIGELTIDSPEFTNYIEK